MKKILITLLFLMIATTAHAETYSKGMVGAGFGDENICLMGSAYCFDDGTDPKVNTDTGYYFYVVPIAVRKDLQGAIGVRMESEFSVSKREFDAEKSYSRGESQHTIKVDGDDTRYSFGGNLLLDYRTDHITPYIGAGVGLEYSKLNANLSGGHGSGPYQIDTHDDFGRYWKWIAGVEVPIVGNLKGNAEYNYRKSDRFRDNDSQTNWNLDGEHIINAGLSLYW